MSGPPNFTARAQGEARGSEDRVFVTLSLAGQLCGIPVQSVRDVLAMHGITRIPLAPPEIAGSLNLRGRIVTAIDLRRRLHLPPAAAKASRMAVVVEHGSELYALLVDEVCEVIGLADDKFERNPPTLTGVWAEHCTGVFRLAGQLMAVLDVASLLAIGAQREAA